MYKPAYSHCDQENLAWDLIREYPLGLIFTFENQKVESNFLPFILTQDDHGYFLLGHMARANPQWHQMTGEVLVSFQGPQRYISPTIYEMPHQVPTWNYAAVQIRGPAEIISDRAGLKQVLNESIHFFEKKNGTNWKYNLPEKMQNQMEAAIVGIKIRIHHVDAKFKLSQNRKLEDEKAVLDFMKDSKKTGDHEMHDWMKKVRSSEG